MVHFLRVTIMAAACQVVFKSTNDEILEAVKRNDASLEKRLTTLRETHSRANAVILNINRIYNPLLLLSINFLIYESIFTMFNPLGALFGLIAISKENSLKIIITNTAYLVLAATNTFQMFNICESATLESHKTGEALIKLELHVERMRDCEDLNLFKEELKHAKNVAFMIGGNYQINRRFIFEVKYYFYLAFQTNKGVRRL
ncbi:Hypothetical predicted protein [Cloeon dipterum]|uniref:Uncharacterized protein n=1 Tax=Cloeon dipterum TaxID=197152 RepID=A0A8S1CQ30_9INSE|nr:Hypothetical predicted protein [Cloeon dipterum]